METGAHVTGLSFEGRRCVGVTFRQGNEYRTVRVTREVVLSGGAINSLQLL